MTIPTIICEECEREWPMVSEQGLHTVIYQHCYHCMLTDITTQLEELKKDVTYTIETCNICAGVEERRHGCRQCNGAGYVVEDKK